MSNPSEHSPLSTVQALYAAFGTGDEAALRRILRDDVEWVQCEGFPGGAHRRGSDDVIAGVMHGNRDTWRDFRVRIDKFVSSGDDVVSFGWYEGEHAGTGKVMRAAFAHAFEVRDGRVATFRQFADTWPMVRAMQA